MKKLFLLGLMGLSVMACERREKTIERETIIKPDQERIERERETTRAPNRDVTDNYNTTKSPMNSTMNQSERQMDRTLVERIRKEINTDRTLPSVARNLQITAANGIVTIRGSVSSDKEREAIALRISNISGVTKIDNQININNRNSKY